MRKALIMLCGVVVGASVFGAAPVAHPVVYRALDDFNDNSLDTAIWNTVAPFSDATPSSVTEANQRIQIHRRGYLVTKGQVKPTATAPVRVTGSFTLTSSDDFFQLLTRADAVPASAGETNNGIEAFARQTAGGDGIILQKRVNDVVTTLAMGTLSIPLNEAFSFSFTDDGKRLSFTLTQVSTPANTITLTATDATVYTTNYVVFHNREFGGYTMLLDDVAIVGRLTTDVNTPLTFWLRGTDADNDPLTYSATLGAQQKGSYVVTGPKGRLLFTPNQDVTGTDQFPYSANDGTANSNTAIVIIFIGGTNATPQLASNSPLQLNEGASAQITGSTLNVIDADNTPEQLTYAILQIPANGTLRLNGVALSTTPLGNTFTQKNIDDGLLTYEHNGTENFNDSMIFTVEDAAGKDLSTGAGVTVQSDFTTLPAGAQLFGSANITTVPGELQFTPSQLSAFGAMTLPSPGVAYREFSVTFSLFIGLGSTPPADGISFNYGGDIPAAPAYWPYESGYTSDGVNAGRGLTVGFDSYAPPEVVVRYSGTVVATFPVANYAQLVTDNYVNVSVTVDSAGQISVIHNGTTLINPTVIPGWNPQPNWSFLIGARTGGLYQTHRIDNLVFTGGGSAAEKTFLMNIRPINDPPVQAVKNGLVVDQGGTAAITSTNLNATDPDTAVTGLSYVLQKLPAHGAVRLSGTPLAMGTSFTQDDVNKNKVDFAHDGASIDPDSFDFMLFDGINFITDFSSQPPGSTFIGGAAVTNNELHLTEAAGNLNAVMILPSPTALRDFTADFELYIGDGNGADGFSFSYGQFADTPLGEEGTTNGLAMCFDTYANGGVDIVGMGIKYNGGFLANELPQSARNSTWTRVTLTVTSAGDVTLVYGGTTLFPNATNPVVNIANWSPQPSWRFALCGRTGGSFDKHYVRDLKITSPMNGATDTLAITVNPVNQTPQIVNNSPLVIDESATAAITAALLRTTDFESTPVQLTYTIIASPNSGSLANNGQPLQNNQFTQKDIDDGRISYAHNGGESASDSFTFKVADADAKETAVKTFAITVNAVNDAPVNTVPGAQTASEDTSFVFSTVRGNAIRTSDVDAASLTVSVSASVLHGTLFASTAGGASVNGNNTAIVTIAGTVAQVNTALEGITYTPASNYSGADTLTILTDDLGHTGPVAATDTDPIAITVQAAADAPAVTAPDASGQQTVAIALNITVALTDTDGSETISQIQITNVPVDATFNRGTDMGNGTWNFAAADLAGLTVTSSGNGSFVMTVSATSRESSNADTATTSVTQTVTLLSIAPTLSNLAATEITEGDTTTLSGTISDPGTTDTFTLTVQWGDGTQTVQPYPASASGSQTFSLTHQYGDNNPSGDATYTIALNIVDSTFESSDAEASVTVNNAAPVASVSQGGTPHISEHSTTLVTVATFTDAGRTDTHRVTIDWGDGSPLESSGAANQNIVIVEPSAPNSFVGRVNARHTFDDGPVQRPIAVTVIDDDNGQSAVNFNILVDNVAPTALFVKMDTANDAFLGAVGFSAQTEPSNADTAAGLKYAYDLAYNGSTPAFTYGLGDGTYANGSTEAAITIPQQYITTSPNHKVLGRIIDKDGGFTDYVLQQPDLHADATQTIFASGALGSAFAYTISADGAPASIVYTVEPVDLPAGVTSLADVGLAFDGTNGINGTFLKSGQVTLKIGAENAAGKAVAYLVITITRVGGNANAPLFSSAPQATPNPALSGETVNFTVAATDANADLLSYLWTFGDGTSSRSSSASHKYAAAGVYDAKITVSDGPNVAVQHVQVVVLTSAPTALSVKSAKITFDFKTPAKSAMQLTGTLPATTLALSGLHVHVTIAGSGYSHEFLLSSKGSGGDALNAFTLGAPKKGAAKFALKTKSTDGSDPLKPSLFQMLSSLGFTNSTTGKTGAIIFVPLVISVQSTPPLNTSASIKTKYVATQGKKGSAALAK